MCSCQGDIRKEITHYCADIAPVTKVLPPPSTLWCLLSLKLLAGAACYLIVGANIQQDREALLRVHPSTCRVQGQLAHRNAHAIAAQVSQAQDAFTISHHHSLKNIAGVIHQG